MSSESIKSGVKNQLRDHLITRLSYSVQSQVNNIASDFVEKEMKEDILRIFETAKPLILAGIQEGVVKVGAKLAEVLFSKALDNLSNNSYRSGEIVKKLFE